jgi:integrase
MTKFVYHQSRKGIKASEYTGAYSLPWKKGRQTVALKTSHKRIAEKRLDQHIERLELEHEGLPVPVGLCGAQKLEVITLLQDYKKYLISMRRAVKHTHDTCTRIESLCKTLKWKLLDDVRPSAFQHWRSSAPINPRTKRVLSAKTLNEYLISINAFFEWAQKLGYADRNPLKFVEKVETRGHEVKKRRAWSDEEFSRFMAEAPQNRHDYRSAVYLMRWTGLRKNEVQTLTWGDVFLDGEQSFLIVRAGRSKNHKEERLPILENVVDFLKRLRPEEVESSRPVLSYKIPASEQLRRDQERMGIKYRTEIGDLDFHSLRHTFGTWLVSEGIDLKQVQMLMRHSDINMTANRYTDISRIPVARTLKDLSKLVRGENCTPICTPFLHTGGQTQSQAVTVEALQANSQVVDVPVPKRDKACHNVTGLEAPNGWPITIEKAN